MARRIPAGEMRHLVMLQRNAGEGTYGTRGEVTDNWTDVREVRARIRTLSGRELELARQTFSQASSEVVIDYQPDFDTLKRFTIGGRTFNVGHYDDVDFEHVQLVGLCSEERVATT